MEKDRKNLRKHIKAATDWLQQADKSIEHEEDIKGDLKLMLAKAELKNAEKHQDHSRLIKFFSLFTAAAIAFGILYFKDDTKEVTTVNLPSTSVAISSESNEAVEQQPSPLPITQSEEIQESAKEPIQTANAPSTIDEPDYIPPLNVTNSYSEVEEEHSTEPIRYIEPEPIFEESTTNVESTYIAPKEPDTVALEARTPTEDMQKLMQSAGQILRAE